MTKFKVGDLVSIEFPFSDLQARKRRPGLVLAAGDLDLVVARITTHPPRDPADVSLTEWAQVGFPCPSTVRLTKLATIDSRLVHHTIGRLRPADRRAVAQAWEGLAAAVAAQLRG